MTAHKFKKIVLVGFTTACDAYAKDPSTYWPLGRGSNLPVSGGVSAEGRRAKRQVILLVGCPGSHLTAGAGTYGLVYPM